MIKLKNKLKILHDSIQDQLKFNSLISDLISEMNINEEMNNDQKKKKTAIMMIVHLNQLSKKHRKNMEENEEMSVESSIPDVENFSSKSEGDNEDLEIEEPLVHQNKKEKQLIDFDNKKYKAYTNEFDEIIKAEELESEEELNRLRQNLDQQLLQLKNFISKLANKLQRKLLAKQNRSWDFDLEEGLLDNSKLARIIIDPFNSLSFKKEKDFEFKDTLVTILIDNSGSMRGKPISVAAICADIFQEHLKDV